MIIMITQMYAMYYVENHSISLLHTTLTRKYKKLESMYKEFRFICLLIYFEKNVHDFLKSKLN